jgi:hypothetical protein
LFRAVISEISFQKLAIHCTAQLNFGPSPVHHGNFKVAQTSWIGDYVHGCDFPLDEGEAKYTIYASARAALRLSAIPQLPIGPSSTPQDCPRIANSNSVIARIPALCLIVCWLALCRTATASTLWNGVRRPRPKWP